MNNFKNTQASDVKNETGYFYGEHQRRLFYQSWKVKDAQGIVFITHGLSENTDRYDRLAHQLNKDKWNVYAWDLRGHGRSSGLRGYVRKFRFYERDLVRFLDFILTREQNLPFILFGHSLGALIVARGLLHEEDIISSANGVCLASPAFGLSINLSLFKLTVSYLTNAVFPWWAYYNKILSANLSRDPYFLNLIENDRFRHNRTSPEIYLTVFKNPKMLCVPQKINSRLLIQLAGHDVIVDNRITKHYFECVKSSEPKKLISYSASMHQMYEDFGHERIVEDFKLFMRPILQGEP